MRVFIEYCSLALLLLVCGCHSSRPESMEPLASKGRGPIESGSVSASVSERTAVRNLTLPAALKLCQRRNSRLAELRARVDGVMGRIQQAGRWSNPELVVRTEQVALNDRVKTFIQPVVGITQQLPLGARRGRTQSLEQQRRRRAERRLEQAQAEVFQDLRGRFASALFMDRCVALQRRLQRWNDSARRLYEVLVKEGDRSGQDLARFELAALNIDLERQTLESLRSQAMLSLSQALGVPGLEVQSVQGELEQRFELQRLESLLGKLKDSPSIMSLKADVRVREAVIELIKAERVPDISVDVFYRGLIEEGVHSVDLGVAVPLPIFDRRQGDLLEARARLSQSRLKQARQQQALSLRLRSLYSKLELAMKRRRLLKTKILPQSRLVLEGMRARLKAGDVSLLELLESQKQALLMERAYLESLRELMVSWSELSALIGE